MGKTPHHLTKGNTVKNFVCLTRDLLDSQYKEFEGLPINTEIPLEKALALARDNEWAYRHVLLYTCYGNLNRIQYSEILVTALMRTIIKITNPNPLITKYYVELVNHLFWLRKYGFDYELLSLKQNHIPNNLFIDFTNPWRYAVGVACKECTPELVVAGIQVLRSRTSYEVYTEYLLEGIKPYQ